MILGVRCLLVASCLLTSLACVPFPHRYQYLPRVEGRLADAGTPVVGARVAIKFLDADTVCDTPEATTTTDGTGQFVLPGERRIGLIVWAVPADFAASWSFCFVPPNGSRVAWTSPKRITGGSHYAPQTIELECDFARRADSVCRTASEHYGKW